MDSELHVTSTSGQGTTFWFDIELPEAPEGEEPVALETRKIIGLRGNLCTILIADDEDENRTMLKEMLLPLGFKIIEAVDGHDALEKTECHHPDLILMDLMMPELSGFEAIRRIREVESRKPKAESRDVGSGDSSIQHPAPSIQHPVIISVSASVFEQTQQDSLAAGSDDFLAKPIRLDNLLEKLQRHLKLEWVYEEAIEDNEDISPKSESRTSGSLTPPSQEELARLFQLAMRGDVSRLQAHAKRLEASDPTLASFAKELYRLATAYQIDEIQQLLAQYMEDES